MAMGKPITKAGVDSLATTHARNFTNLLNSLEFAEFAQSILSLNAAGLEGLGYTTAEANVIIAFVNEANTLITAYNAANKGRFFARQLYGLYNG